MDFCHTSPRIRERSCHVRLGAGTEFPFDDEYRPRGMCERGRYSAAQFEEPMAADSQERVDISYLVTAHERSRRMFTEKAAVSCPWNPPPL